MNLSLNVDCLKTTRMGEYMNIENGISQEEKVLRIFVLKDRAIVKKLVNCFIVNNGKSTTFVFCKNKLLPEMKIGTRRTS